MRSSFKIDEISRVILQNFWGEDGCDAYDANKYSRLYHYTSPDAGLKILEVGKENCGFAFTHFEYLNDDAEFKLGLEVAKKWIRANEKLKTSGILYDRIETKLKELEKKHCYIPYVLSLSTKADSTELWMSYSEREKGGYAIGLDSKKIFELVDSQPDMYAIRNGHRVKLARYMFAPCLYCRKESVSKYWKAERDRLSCVLNTFFDGYLDARVEESEEFALWCASRLFQFAALFKSSDFRFEREWRLVIKPLSSDYLRELKFIGGKPRIIPTCFPMNSCVQNIIVSPHGQKSLLKRSVELMLGKAGMKTKARESASTYNGR